MAKRPLTPRDLEAINKRMGAVIGGSIPIRYEEVSKDRVVATMQVDRRVHQPAGILHGGASLVLAESVASVGAGLNCAEGMTARGQEINANHLRPVRQGVVRGVATPVHVGRTSQVWAVEIRDDEGKLVCISRCTLAVVAAPDGNEYLPPTATTKRAPAKSARRDGQGARRRSTPRRAGGGSSPRAGRSRTP